MLYIGADQIYIFFSDIAKVGIRSINLFHGVQYSVLTEQSPSFSHNHFVQTSFIFYPETELGFLVQKMDSFLMACEHLCYYGSIMVVTRFY